MTIATTAVPALRAHIPGAKSITEQVLLLAAAANGTSRLRRLLVDDDTLAFRNALNRMGVLIGTGQDGENWEVTGTGRGPLGGDRIWCDDADSAARLLPPFAATGRGYFVFDGGEQLRTRPLWPLADALNRLGVVVGTGPDGGLPLRVTAQGTAGGRLVLDGAPLSSRYATGLLLAAPLMRAPLTVCVREPADRRSLDVTVALMRRFGARVVDEGNDAIRVEPGGYTATDLTVEPDAGTACYLFAAAVATGRSVTVPGLGSGSLQAGLRFTEALRSTGACVQITQESTTVTGVGALRGGFDVDMDRLTGAFPALAVLAPFADAPITVHGVSRARLEQPDRITAVVANLRACGIRVDEDPDRITVHPGRPTAARLLCDRDRHLAMAFSVLGLRAPGIVVDDRHRVGGTFPGFHAELSRLFPRSARLPAAGRVRAA